MKRQSAFPTEVPPELWNGSWISPLLLEAEQRARVAVPWKPGLAYGIHRFGVTWSMPTGKASTQGKFCLTTALLIFPATALVHGQGFEVTALSCRMFRWEHCSTPWALWGEKEGVKKIFLTMLGSLRHWKVKLLWLGALWGKLLFSWDCSSEGDGECCLVLQPWAWAEVPAGKPGVRCLLNISCQFFFLWGCFWLLPTYDIVLLRSLGTFLSQHGTPWVSRLAEVSSHFCSLYSGKKILI